MHDYFIKELERLGFVQSNQKENTSYAYMMMYDVYDKSYYKVITFSSFKYVIEKNEIQKRYSKTTIQKYTPNCLADIMVLYG